MRVGIMQPTFCPWLGYFELISKVDLFIYLDDVAYTDRSWQTRNWFCNDGKPLLLTIPVINTKQKSLLCEKQLHNPEFHCNKFQKRIRQMYPKCSELNAFHNAISQYFSDIMPDLASKNISIVEQINYELGIQVEVLRSSEIAVTGSKANYIRSLIKHVNADTYVAANGSREYMSIFGLDAFECNIEFFNYPRSIKFYSEEKASVYYSAMHYILSKQKSEIKNILEV